MEIKWQPWRGRIKLPLFTLRCRCVYTSTPDIPNSLHELRIHPSNSSFKLRNRFEIDDWYDVFAENFLYRSFFKDYRSLIFLRNNNKQNITFKDEVSFICWSVGRKNYRIIFFILLKISLLIWKKSNEKEKLNLKMIHDRYISILKNVNLK